MSFDIAFAVAAEEEVPTPAQLEQLVLRLPNMTPADEVGNNVWKYEYLNLETSVSFTVSYRAPGDYLLSGVGKDTGMQASIPTTCPTFVARECLPIVEQLAKSGKLSVSLPSGAFIEPVKVDASAIQLDWSAINRMTVIKLSTSRNIVAHYFPQEQLDEMWRYLNARQALLKRYSALGIYVPRVILIRNKLDRSQMFRAMMWNEMTPTVVPDVDAYIIGRPASLFLNRFPRGEYKPTVVRKRDIAELIEPELRRVQRPIPHDILESASAVRLPIFRKMLDLLQPIFNSFETVTVDDVVDVQV